jgi:choline dehydrogenase-like flavoprotein
MSRAPFKPSQRVDFIVAGSGAAGGAMAKELAAGGFSVVALEQGPYLRKRDFKHDELGGEARERQEAGLPLRQARYTAQRAFGNTVSI